MKDFNDLKKDLIRIDGRGYKAYKDLQGRYNFRDYVLSIDHVQGDPFASPSRIRVIINQDDAKFPYELYKEKYKNIALSDLLTRIFYENIYKYSKKIFGSGKSGLIAISRCPQEILERTAVIIDKNKIECRFYIGFPARGRSVLAKELEKILYEVLPKIVENTFKYENLDKNLIKNRIELVEDQEFIRNKLKELNLVAFIANDSILPRESGVSTKPLKDAKRFKSPKELEVELMLPNKGKIKGMGIKRGVTIIIGGGYHGKSTLLKALELGVYNHVPGDGREFVITDNSALKVRAEDGRVITKTDISLFINNLPNKKDTVSFYTENASGSTSQAANIVEGMESGTNLFLIDEDTSATNFMLRDDLMQKLVAKEKEPITPFIEIVRAIYEQVGISTIIVVGSSGDFFDIADTVIQMDSYEPFDVTRKAKELSNGNIIKRIEKNNLVINPRFDRKLLRGTIEEGYKGVKIKTLGIDGISINKENIDLRSVEQIVDSEQLNAVGSIMRWIENNKMKFPIDLDKAVDVAINHIIDNGLINIDDTKGGWGSLAMPRKQEIMATYNRYRSIKIK